MGALAKTGLDPHQEWETPPDLWKAVCHRFGAPQVDVCATSMNAKCERFITPEQDGLKTQWDLRGNTAWCNPGYANVLPWLTKARKETVKHGAALVLTHCDPSVEWWALAMGYANEVLLLNPRVQFLPAPGVNKSSNSRGNALWIFRSAVQQVHYCAMSFWQWKRDV